MLTKLHIGNYKDTVMKISIDWKQQEQEKLEVKAQSST
jgi:hypothetical protein